MFHVSQPYRNMDIIETLRSLSLSCSVMSGLFHMVDMLLKAARAIERLRSMSVVVFFIMAPRYWKLLFALSGVLFKCRGVWSLML